MLTSRWPNDACRTTSIKIGVWTSHLVMLDVRTLQRRPSHPAFLRSRISSDLSTSQQVDANKLAAQVNELAVMGEELKEAECFTTCFASSCRSSMFTRKMPLLL